MMKQDDEAPISSVIDTADISEVIANLKHMIASGDVPADTLNAHLEKIEAHVESVQTISESQKTDIIKLLNKHPYFKNPCHYHIRLVTLMKYLKRKGIDTSIKDIDLIVDDLIAGLDGVTRVEYGRYYIAKS